MSRHSSDPGEYGTVPPPAPPNFEWGWMELYRDRRLVALWTDLGPLDEHLSRVKDRSRSYHLIARGGSGCVYGRYLVRFREHSLAEFIPVKIGGKS